MTVDLWLLIVHASATWVMVGVIWFVQIVHYPLFAGVGVVDFPQYETDHKRKTTWVVLPPMMLELFTAIAICWRSSNPDWLVWGNLATVIVLWASTFFVQVPLHEKLNENFDREQHRKLVRTNWLRTWVWSARGVLVWMLIPGVGA